MRPKLLSTWAVLTGLIVFLIVSFAWILEMRFSPGDIYPHYSTKRSDPLGARALYESLEKLPGTEVSRNIGSLQRIKGLDDDTTLVLLGLSRNSLKEMRVRDDSPVLEAVRNGARLVIVMNPGFVPANFDKNDDVDNWLERREKLKKNLKKKEDRADEGKDKGDSEDKGEDVNEDDNNEDSSGIDVALELERGELFLNHVSIDLMVPDLLERRDEGWAVEGVDFEYLEESENSRPELPKVFPNWRSQFRFKELGVLWNEIAVADGMPVVVERSYGKGTVVLTSDSYFASNEALWKGEDTSLLWWLMGGKGRVVFDETIHGNVEHGGIMKLIRGYRLHGFFVGAFIFIALLAWSSGSSLVPGSDEMARGLMAAEGAVVGEDASSGLVRLLRRSVLPGELLEKCVEIWKKNDGKGGRSVSALTPDQKNELNRLLTIRKNKPKEMSLSKGYEKLVQVLNRRQ